MELKPKLDVSYLETQLFINEVTCILSDFKAIGTDLLGDNSSLSLVSHIVMKKLADVFRQELTRKINKCFPKLNDLFQHYSDDIRTFNMMPLLKLNHNDKNTNAVQNNSNQTFLSQKNISKLQ